MNENEKEHEYVCVLSQRNRKGGRQFLVRKRVGVDEWVAWKVLRRTRVLEEFYEARKQKRAQRRRGGRPPSFIDLLSKGWYDQAMAAATTRNEQELVGVLSVSAEELGTKLQRSAYRKLALQVHPDKFLKQRHKSFAEEAIKRLNEARELYQRPHPYIGRGDAAVVAPSLAVFEQDCIVM